MGHSASFSTESMLFWKGWPLSLAALGIVTCQSRSEVGILPLLERDAPFLLGWLGGRMKAWAAGATFAITWGDICGLLNKSRSDSRKEKDPVDIL